MIRLALAVAGCILFAATAHPARHAAKGCTTPPANLQVFAARGWDVWSEYTPANGSCEWMLRPTHAVAVRACVNDPAYTRALRAQCVADFLSAGRNPAER